MPAAVDVLDRPPILELLRPELRTQVREAFEPAGRRIDSAVKPFTAESRLPSDTAVEFDDVNDVAAEEAEHGPDGALFSSTLC